MNNKRRNRTNATRSRSPEQQQQPHHQHEGVYTNQHFTVTSAGMLGCIAQVDTSDGNIFRGVFSSFSSQFQVVLEFVQLLDGPEATSKNKHHRRMIFDPKNIVNMSFKNVDPKYATRDGAFQTDASISKYERNGQVSGGEKELQPWVGDCNGDDMDLSLGTDIGWDANAMFKTNEEIYGVRSSFDHSLAGYTTTIERSDSKGFKDAEARAARIASEIERNSKSQAQAELENGDEEERFAAVVRPRSDDSNSPPRSQEKTGKYIPPVRRTGGGFQGRLVPRSTPFPPGHVSSPSLDDQHHERNERRPEEIASPSSQVPANNMNDDNRNNNSCSPAAAPVPINSPLPPPAHARNINSNNNNNSNGRGKPYMMQPAYAFAQPPRFPPAGHPPLVQHRPMPPPNQQPPPAPAIQHGPPPVQPMPTPVFTQQLPPNHAHQTAIPTVPAIPQENVAQPMQVQQLNHPPSPNINIVHGLDNSGMAHVHMPPHGVQHGHPVALPAGYVHEHDPRGHRNTAATASPAIRAHSPRVYPTNNKQRFTAPPFQPPVPQRKTRSDEMNELTEFSTNMKLPSESEAEVDEKQDSPPIDQWNKGRSPPSNSSAEDAANTLKKSTLNPNAKEFVYNPSAKPFTPRPPNTPGPSRPHTPQTPAQSFGYSPGPAAVPTVLMPATYVMQPTFSHQAAQPRLQMAPRPDISSSQMQVAAATGQPLLAPAPLQRFVAPYHNPPPQPYQQMVRMVPGQGPVVFHEGASHVQYMHSPHGQPHPATGQFQQAQHQQFPMVSYVPLTQAAMMQYFQQPPQPGQQPQHVQVIVPNQ